MPEAKHTPGPWIADDYAIADHFSGSGRYVRATERHWAICRVDATGGCSDSRLDVSEDEAEANARLIAAAPDMLEALLFLMQTKWVSKDRDNMEFLGSVTCYQLDKIRAAIAKATGG